MGLAFMLNEVAHGHTGSTAGSNSVGKAVDGAGAPTVGMHVGAQQAAAWRPWRQMRDEMRPDSVASGAPTLQVGGHRALGEGAQPLGAVCRGS